MTIMPGKPRITSGITRLDNHFRPENRKLDRSGMACPPVQAFTVQYNDLAAAYLYYLAGNEPSEDLVRRGTGSSGEAGQHFLGHGYHNAFIVPRIQLAQIQEPTQNAPFDGYVQRLEQITVELLHSRGKELYEKSVDAGIGCPEALELVPAK
jgi:hypothetical protein